MFILKKPPKQDFKIRIFFGNIGCGKTTCAVRTFKKMNKIVNNFSESEQKNLNIPIHFYSNFHCKLSNFNDLSRLGLFTFPENTHLIVDEAGIVYNNRKFKTLPQHTIEWYKLCRHYKCSVDIYSQSFDDMDITLRRLSSELWYVKKLGPFTLLRRIYKRVGVDEVTHQIIDKYEFGKLLPCFLPGCFHRHNFEIFLRKPYYKYFDSFEKQDLPLFLD